VDFEALVRIGIDATCWHNTRGYGRHARALLRALVRLDQANGYTFFLDAPNDAEPLPPEAEVHLVRTSAPAAVAASSNGHRSLHDMWRMSRALSASGCDLLLFPTVYSYVPVLSRAKKVVMIHDVIAEKYPQLTLPNRVGRLFWKAKVALGRWQADALVTVSDHSQRGIVEHFKVAPERVHVVGEASDPVFRLLDDPRPTARLEGLGLAGPGRAVVYVGGFSPHKNLDTLVAAFAQVAAQEGFADVRLVMVGEYAKEVFHSYFGTIKQQVDSLGLGDRVVFTGYLPDEELVVLLNRATVLALPSYLEGFGLPAVEAAACGCPVLATTASPLPGLLGEGGQFVDPHDRSGWERALVEVLRSEDLRRRMREAGLAAARRLTWEAAAQQLIDVLRKVVAA
jgi:glycosyltransferase involved in cell wall biosynthesis